MVNVNAMAVGVRAAVQLRTEATVSDARLRQWVRQQYGIDGRRLGRLSLLALAGALAVAGAATPEAVYLATAFGSAPLLQRMLDNVVHEGVAKPFDFLANLHNAPVFHVAAALGCCGQTLLLPTTQVAASWSAPLRLALNDLLCGHNETALVGWCYEHQPHCGEQVDGSHWLYLQRHPAAAVPQLWLAAGQGEAPSAVAVDGDYGADYYYQGVAAWIAAIGRAGVRMLPLDARTALFCHGVEGFVAERVLT